jgi:hypothetical protein
MICLECAIEQPGFRPLKQPAALEKLPCTACGNIKLCIIPSLVGLPGMTPDDAFKMIATLVRMETSKQSVKRPAFGF